MRIVLKKAVLEGMMAQYGDDVYSLAKRMEVAPSTIYRILNGDRGIGNDLIVKFMKAFDLSEKEFDTLFVFSE
ncbi:hypothetical protein NRIC_21280 [Enterococcus florum]|uniref:HTH cro/C1-type domain-containing protein n=1 Tax=Enterococcus florum TaxID=2480627 RepID=A0A4P5P8C2_9ENTE|nr:helix-turn-helix domain-containing protein [Enterococcus florum]GCF94237.1 hypothetical protein NRIC_21280 [Enterococcus florum]